MVCRGKFPVLLPSKKYQEWHTSAIWEIKSQRIALEQIKKLTTPLKVTIKMWSKTKRKFDLSNKVESVNDLLVDCGVIPDDNYTVIQRLEVEFCGYGKDFCEILISEYDSAKI